MPSLMELSDIKFFETFSFFRTFRGIFDVPGVLVLVPGARSFGETKTFGVDFGVFCDRFWDFFVFSSAR